ncbi:hypothetical protein NE237_024278 [Protea cynaroides]|uniref:NB-ARC domain-containing protein n=1 Tax=Protea cynaroides TaxID=273540 RepID=A0A9Q0K597_9MAGN|nr:hypothetical protein NE237_024278 [Protea cynaroides]
MKANYGRKRKIEERKGNSADMEEQFHDSAVDISQFYIFSLSERRKCQPSTLTKLNSVGLNPSIGACMASRSLRPRLFNQIPQTSSLVNRSKVVGREEDMWEIIKWLLSEKKSSSNNNNNNFSVLSIVGSGGIGKTTLAQLVYNDEKVENHFGLKAWVCVSKDFNVVRLTKEILESATGSSPQTSSLDLLQTKLKEALNKKRFLLVLDDMQKEIYERWEDFRTVFTFGKPGSKILVTTRNKSISSMIWMQDTPLMTL